MHCQMEIFKQVHAKQHVKGLRRSIWHSHLQIRSTRKGLEGRSPTTHDMLGYGHSEIERIGRRVNNSMHTLDRQPAVGMEIEPVNDILRNSSDRCTSVKQRTEG